MVLSPLPPRTRMTERDLSRWTPRPRPDGATLEGRWCRLERLDSARHGDGLYEASIAPGAADRFGFAFEGIFRNHMVVKGQNRDTAWYAMTDDDWPKIKAGMGRWLHPTNFDTAGLQRKSLTEMTAAG